MSAIVIAEHDHQQLTIGTYHAIAAAKQMSDEIKVMVIGHHCQSVAHEASHIADVKEVWLFDSKDYAHQLAENTSALIAECCQQEDYIIAATSTFSKNILPRVAALLDVSMLTDVTKVISTDTFCRPLYAGNIIATVQLNEKIKVLTIRQASFSAAEKIENGESAPIQKIEKHIPCLLSQFESEMLTQSKRPDLTAARIIISGGRGLKSAENFRLLEKIADQLGAAVGASRAAVDAGLAPNDYQIGQTGKMVAPDLYIAVGISGAIQHVAGMKDSKVIVAINQDPDAPIFAIADYILVGDLFKILPELSLALEKNKV